MIRAICICGEVHLLDRKTLDSMRGGVAERFVSELEAQGVPYIKGKHGGPYYLIGAVDDICRCIGFYRHESKAEINGDLVTVHRAPVDDMGSDRFVSSKFIMMPISCPFPPATSKGEDAVQEAAEKTRTA